MAYKYQYSKMFSKNGAPIAAVKLSDLIGVSTPSTVGATSPWGFDSKDKTLAAIQKYFYNDIRVDGIGQFGIFKEGGGIIGAGTSADPIRIDKDWMNKRYIPAGNFPISQVGDPSDFVLSISGSYFSVSYPYGSLPCHSTGFVEGNGDLRLLHHVTNGEEIRPVYALWKSYQDMPARTIQYTDVPYTPPGLSAGEYIRSVYPCSETAMLVDIYSGSGFKEHGVVILNGTMVSKFHRVVRLGDKIFTRLLGQSTGYSSARLIALHAYGLTAAVVNGKIYVAAMLAPSGEGSDNSAVAFKMAEISLDSVDTAAILPFASTNCTNCEGGVQTRSDNLFILHKALTTVDPNDKDAWVKVVDGVSIFPGYNGVSPGNFISFSGVTADGKIIATTYHYKSATARNSVAIKPLFFYLIDPVARTCVPAPGNSGRRWDISVNKDRYLVIDRKGTIEYNGGHYWSGGHIPQLLGDGTRLIHLTPGGSDVGYLTYTYKSKGEHDPLSGTLDDNFRGVNNWGTANYRDAGTPTPTKPTGTGYIVYDNLFTVDRPTNALIASYNVVRNRLIGSETAKTFTVYTGGDLTAVKSYPGYELNNERTSLGGKEGGPFVVVKDNVPYYHTGYFHHNQGDANNGKRKWGWDSDGVAKGNYYCAPEVYTAMENLWNTLPYPEDYVNKSDTWNWTLIAPYPGVGVQKAIVKIIIPHYRIGEPTTNNPSGREGRCTIWMGALPCNVTVDPADNTATINSVDVNALDTAGVPYGGQWYAYNASNQNERFGGYCHIKTDGSWVVNFRAGDFMGTDEDGNYNGWCSHVLNINASNAITWQTTAGYQTANVTQPATWHSKHGFGFIDSGYGIGCFYAFVPLTERGAVDSTRSVIFLGSARPAAGFNLTVSSPITVYVRGTTKTLPIQTFDLRTVKPDARNSVFHIAIYAPANSTTALLDISLTPQVDTADRIYLGRIVTSDTEITEMTLEPVTRWESKRTSLEAVGSAILVTPGFPGESEDIAAISAGIDPTKWTGNVRFDKSAEIVYITQDGTFFIQDKELAISRYGSYFQIYISGGTNGARGYLNGTEIWKGKGQSSNVVNRDALVREGWNTVHVVWGDLHIRGPFLKMGS